MWHLVTAIVVAFHSGFPGLKHPVVPGHEIVGIVDQVGSDVGRLKVVGDRVGIGWHGGHCHGMPIVQKW